MKSSVTMIVRAKNEVSPVKMSKVPVKNSSATIWEILSQYRFSITNLQGGSRGISGCKVLSVPTIHKMIIRTTSLSKIAKKKTTKNYFVVDRIRTCAGKPHLISSQTP